MEGNFSIELVQQANYQFEVHFDNPAVPALLTDESAPLGSDAGPSPSRLLAVAVANCLCASLLFALRKFHNEPGTLRAQAHVSLDRNAERRLRVQRIDVALHLGVPAAQLRQLERILTQFEEFCVVTQSVRAAIPVGVEVVDCTGARLHASTAPDEATPAATLVG